MKIDRSYIGEVGASDQADSLLASLMHLARSLHLDVVAEGVETDRQVDHLRTIGCPKFQGFLFARRMPAEQFAAWEQSHPLSCPPSTAPAAARTGPNWCR